MNILSLEQIEVTMSLGQATRLERNGKDLKRAKAMIERLKAQIACMKENEVAINKALQATKSHEHITNNFSRKYGVVMAIHTVNRAKTF